MPTFNHQGGPKPSTAGLVASIPSAPNSNEAPLLITNGGLISIAKGGNRTNITTNAIKPIIEDISSKSPSLSIPIPSSVLSRPKRQRFLPLNTSTGQAEEQEAYPHLTNLKYNHATIPKSKAWPRPLKGIIFDLDGTLCTPQTWMFASMRAVLGIPKTTDILTHITTLSTPELQKAAHDKVKSIEIEGMKQMSPSVGLVPLLTYLSERGIKKGICTRNFDGPVTYLISNFCNGYTFEPIVTRDFHPSKPDPAGLVHIGKSWGLSKEELRDLIMVGDSKDDMLAGKRAGCATCLLLGEHNQDLINSKDVDVVISRLDELVELLDKGLNVFDDIPS